MSAEEALEYIKSRPEGALQSDLWKALKIDSRKCSRIVAKLLKDNLITREVESVDGIRTYRLFSRPQAQREALLSAAGAGYIRALRWLHRRVHTRALRQALRMDLLHCNEQR